MAFKNILVYIWHAKNAFKVVDNDMYRFIINHHDQINLEIFFKKDIQNYPTYASCDK